MGVSADLLSDFVRRKRKQIHEQIGSGAWRQPQGNVQGDGQAMGSDAFRDTGDMVGRRGLAGVLDLNSSNWARWEENFGSF